MSCPAGNRRGAFFALAAILLVSLPGATWAQNGGKKPARDARYLLTLGEQQFDPLVESPDVPAALAAPREVGDDLRLVQFAGPVTDDQLAGLHDADLRIVQYIHPHTYVVWGDGANTQGVQRAGHARWTGDFQPAYRLLPRWRGLPAQTEQFRALVIRAADAERVTRKIAATGATLTGRLQLDQRFDLVGFELAGDRVDAVARIPGVYSVQKLVKDGGLRGELSNQVNANNMNFGQAYPGYNDWLDALGLSGAGVIIANVDSGVEQDHPDLVNRVLSCVGQTCGNTILSSHGTHTAGIMAADGSSAVRDGRGFLRGLGVAPGAQLVEQLYSPWAWTPGGMLLLMRESYSNGASISGNSWGPSSTPKGYDDKTLQVDIGVRDVDPTQPGDQSLNYVLSIMNGNGGVSTQGTPDEAKNAFTIGSTKMQQTPGGQQYVDLNNISANSAHGPCLDGRNIPHMVAPGCAVDSTDSGGKYALKCGTSMASPHVSGAVALFIEYYRDLPGYVADPSPALVKAAFLPVAHDLAGNRDADGGLLGHPFDSKQGWGRMNLEAVVDPPLSVRYYDQQVVFDQTGEEWTTSVIAEDPDQPIRMMLVWTDAPGHGLGGSTPAWNNDLDLIVDDGTNTYYGNSFGPDGWSATGGVADYMHNTEGVFLGPTAPHQYTVRVVATNINSDGVPNLGDLTDQDFALVCYNCLAAPDFNLFVAPVQADVCRSGEGRYTITVEPVSGFNQPVALSVAGAPNGAEVTIEPNPVTPPGISTLTVSVPANVTPGAYALEIVGQAGDHEHSAIAPLRVFSEPPGATELGAPPDGATGVDVRPAFEWLASGEAGTYELEVALDTEFTQVVLQATGITGTSFQVIEDLAANTEHYWRVRAVNACGNGAWSTVFRFTTRTLPAILLVDDDNDNPDVRGYYTATLAALNRDFDVWATFGSDDEPSVSVLSRYATVIWFTGANQGSACGPGVLGTAALAEFLEAGKNLLISGQDLYVVRGVTPFLEKYCGVLNGAAYPHNSLIGIGPLYGGVGTYVLSYPFANRSHVVNPDATAAIDFIGDAGNAVIHKDDPVYRTMYWGAPFEAVPTADDREQSLGVFLDWTRPWADCNGNGVGDHADISRATSRDTNHNGVPDECELVRGDLNCDGIVDFADINPFVLALTDWNGWRANFPDCPEENADVNADGLYGGANGFGDINPFVALLTQG